MRTWTNVVKIYPVLCPLKEDQEYQDFEMDDQLPALVAVPDVLMPLPVYIEDIVFVLWL